MNGRTTDGTFEGTRYTIETYDYPHKPGWGARGKCSGSSCKSVVLGTDDLNPHSTEASAKKTVLTKVKMHILRCHGN